MKQVKTSFLPWIYIGLLMASMAAGLLTATPSPQDDFSLYQSFIESLAGGKFDLAIPGFHGTDIWGFAVYMVTRSPIAQIYGLMIAAILLPFFAFIAGKELFKSEWHGVVLASIITMMSFVSFVCLRGWTGPGYWSWMLLTVWAAARQSRFTGIFWALAILSKPFAVILLPLIFVLQKKRKKIFSILNFQFSISPSIITGLLIVAVYLLAQYIQAGQIFVGAHADLSPVGAFQGTERILLNLAHSFQILFSVHNYYYPDPALTGPGNMMHTSPVLIFLGLFGLLAAGEVWKKQLNLASALLAGALFGIAMNAMLDHMDHFYMEASILLFVLAALPVLRKYPLWIPLALLTLHFQPFYFWMQYQSGFALTWWFWAPIAVIDICFAGWLLGLLTGSCSMSSKNSAS